MITIKKIHLSVLFFLISICSIRAQILVDVKDQAIEKVQEKALEKSDEIQDVIMEKIEGIFKKKKDNDDDSVITENNEKDKPEKPKVVRKVKTTRDS